MDSSAASPLDQAWEERLRLWAAGDQLWAEAALIEGGVNSTDAGRFQGETSVDNYKRRAEARRLLAKGDLLRAEDARLKAEGALVWVEAVLAARGNITMRWEWHEAGYTCVLETGERFEPMPRSELRSRVIELAKFQGWLVYAQDDTVPMVLLRDPEVATRLENLNKAACIVAALRPGRQPEQNAWLEAWRKITGVAVYTWCPSDLESGEIERCLS